MRTDCPRSAVFPAVLLLWLLAGGQAAAAGYRQPDGVFGGSGGSGTSASFAGTSAAGQGTGSGLSASDNYRNRAGFINAGEDGSATPRVTEVSSASPEGLYGPGSSIDVAVNFTEPVSSAGLKIGLNSGGSVSTGPLAGVTRWRGAYVVGPGEVADRLAAVAIAGAITAESGRTAVDPAVPARKNFAAVGGIGVDAAGPAVAISRPSSPGTAAGPVTYTVTYTDANFRASTLAAGAVALKRTGTANGTVGVTGAGATWTVTISGISGNGTLGISLAKGTAVDLIGNSAPAAGPSASFEVDNTPPALLGVTSGNDHGQYPAGSPIAVTVSFSEAVSSTGLTVELDSGATLSTGPLSAATSWSGTSVVGAGQTSADLSVAAIRGTITDGRGHETIDPAVPARRNIADARAIVIDTTAPAVSIGPPSAFATRLGPVAYPVSYTDANFAASTLAAADITLNRTGTADGVVAVSGTGAARKVTVSGLSGSGTLGISVAAGTATDGAGNKAPAAGPSETFQVDGTAPSVTSVTSTTTPGHYKAGDVINVTVSFSEPVYSAGLAINLSSGVSVTTGALNGVARYSGDYRVAAGQQAGSLSVAAITGKFTDALGSAVIDPPLPPGRNIADSTPIVVDTLAPSVAISAPSPAVTRSGPVTYTATYQDLFFTTSTLTVGDVSLNRTGSANGTVAVAGTGGTRTLTIDGITGDGTLSVSLAAGTAKDLAGNAAAAVTGEPVLVDTTPPRVTGAASPAADGHYGAGSEIVVTVNFSEAVSSPGLTITLNSGGSASTGALDGVARCSARYAVGAGQTAADLSIVAIAGTITDRVGNASTDPTVPAGENIADAKAIVVDTTAPGVAIGAPSAAATRAGPVTYAVTYADANFGGSTLASGDITLHRTGTADGTVVVTGTGSARTVEIRNASGDGTLGISVAAGTATDLAGNRAPAAGPAAAFLVDHTLPAVTGVTSATADGFYKAGSAIDVTVHFSTAVSSPGLTLKLDSGGTVSTGPFKGVTSRSGISTVAAGQSSGDLSVVSITGTITDALGNRAVNPAVTAGMNIADGRSIVVDTTAPAVSIGAPSVPVTKATPVTYAVTYADSNLKSSALGPAQVTLVRTGSADGAVSVTGSGTAWTVTITPTAGSGTLGISVAAGTAADLAGNNAPAPKPGVPFQVDDTPPAVARATSTTANGHYKAGSPISVVLNFTEPVSSAGLTINLNSGGTASTGPLSGVTACSAISQVEDGQTTPDLSVSSIKGSISDAVTNVTVDPVVPAGRNIADSKAIVVDTTAPTVAIGAPSSAAVRTGPVRYGVTYADTNFSTSTLAAGDVTLTTTGTAGGRVGVSGTAAARTVTISDVTGDGTLGISLAAGTASDAAGNRAPAAGPSATLVADNTPPRVTGASSTTADNHYKAGSAIDVTVAFSEPVWSPGLTITLNSGGKVRTGALKGVTSHSGNYTIEAGQNSADLDISVITGTILDAAGNAAADPPVPAGKNIADLSDILVDTTAPVVSIGAPSVSATKAGPVTYPVTCADTNFSSCTFGVGDVTLNRSGTANGTVEVSGAAARWTVTVTSTTGTGTLGIALAAGTAMDIAGNGSRAAGPSATFSVDNTPPAVTGATSAAADGHYKAGGMIDVTLSFSEPVSSPGLKIALNTGGSVSTGAFSGLTSWSGTYAVEAGQTAADLDIAGIAGTIVDGTANETVDPAVPAGKNIANVKAIVVDTTAPTVEIGPPSAAATRDGPVTYKVTYADTNFGSSALAAGDVSLDATGTARGTVRVTAASATTRWVTISDVTGDGSIGISLAAGTAQDRAGNRAPGAGPGKPFVVDTTPPTVTAATSSTGDGFYKAGGAIDVTVSFDAAVSSAGLTIKLNSGGTTSTGPLNRVTSCSVAYLVGPGQTAADLGIASIAGTISDAVGNQALNPAVPAGRNISDGKAIVVDTRAPAVAIGAPSVSSTRNGPVTYVVTATDENFDTNTLGAGGITLSRTGTADGIVAVSGTGPSRTVTISSATGDGTLGIAVSAGSATDRAGNSAPAAGPSAPFRVDNTPPAVAGATSSSTNGYYRVGDKTDVTLNFSESVSSPKLTASLTSGGEVIFEPFSGATSCRGSYVVGDGETASDLSVVGIAGTIVDGVANAAVDPAVPAGKNIADFREIVVDTTAPAVSIGGPSAAVTGTGPVSYTVSYADPNFGASTLAAADVALVKTGTAAGKLAVTGAGSARTVTISGATGDGTLSLLLAAGTARDKAGNLAPAAGPSATLQVDNTPPVVTNASSTTANGYYRADSAIDVTVDFDTAVSTSGLTIALNSGGTVSTGPLSNVMGWSGVSTVRAGQTAADASVDTISGTIKDAAGNALINPPVPAGRNIADAKAIVVDTTAPAVTIGAPSVASTRAGPVTFAVTCADTNLDTCVVGAGDITLNRTGSATGTLGVTGTGTTRTVTISDASGDGTLGISVAAGRAADLAGNRAPAAGPSADFQVDNTPPAVAGATSTTADGHYAADDPIDVTVNFDEAVSSAGLTIALNSGGTVSTGAFSGATSCRGNYTVAAGQSAADLSIAAIGGRITDASGNETVDPALPAGKNLADARAIVIDTTAPTVEIGPPSATVIKAGPVAYTVTYADTNFGAGTLAAGDVALNRTGSAAGTVGVTGTGATRTVTISGASGDGTLSIALAAGTAKDKAGNPAPAAGPSAAVTVDNALPTVTVAASVASAAEAGTTAGQFTVAREGSTNFDLVVNYAISGTTVASDYAALTGSVTIPAGAATQTITVTPVDDTAVEGDETVVATLKAGAAYLVGTPARAAVTILSDDGLYAPAVGTVAPLPLTTPVGRAQTFDATYSDRDGSANLQRVGFRVYLPSVAKYLSLGYDRTANTVMLYDEGGTTAVGSCSPGTAVSLSNTLGVVDCAATAMSVSGNDLTVRWSIAPSAAGASAVQARATDVTGKATEWTDKGTWRIIATNQAPTAATVVPAALTSPPRVALTFSAVYADADGSANIRTASLLVNATENVANGIRLSYDRLANRLFLFDDAGTAALDSCTPQENKNLSNAQGTLFCAATTVNASDDTLTVNWNIASQSAFAAAAPWNLYLQAVDMSDASAAWTDLADWTVTPTNFPPTPESVTPALSTSTFGTAQTFSAVYGDPDGFANLRTLSLLVNARPTAAGGILVHYDRTVNRLSIFDDSGRSPLDSCTPGQATSIPPPRQALPSSAGSLNCALTTVADSGKEIRVNWNITPRAAFASAPRKSIYLSASDLSDASAAWTDKGDWLITGETPTTGTVSPAALSSAPDTAQSFTAVYRDPGGYQNMKQVSFLVNTTASAAHGIRVSYDGQWLRLYNDAGKEHVGYCRPGEAGSLSNTQGTLDCASTTVNGSGNDLAVTWSITPSAAFASKIKRNIYIDPLDTADADIGWADAGDWTIDPAVVAPPSALTLTPAALTSEPSAAQTFSAVYLSDGRSAVKSAALLVNARAATANGIFLLFDVGANKLFLYDDAGTATVGSCAPGQAASLSNSQGTLNCAAATVIGSGDNLTVDWVITPSAAFASAATRNVYLSKGDTSAAGPVWTDLGDWTVKRTVARPTAGRTVTPAALTSAPGVPRTFSAVYSDGDGYANLKSVSLLMNSSGDTANGIWLVYDRLANKLHLYDDAGTVQVGSCAPGEQASLSNASGTLNCAATTVSGSGNDLTVSWNITPGATSEPARKDLYLSALDMSGDSTGWQDQGDWTLKTTNVPPTPATVTPQLLTSAYWSPRTISAVYTDADGVANVRAASLLLNATPTASNGITLVHDRTVNRLYMQNDAGTGTVGTCAPGADVYFGNSQGQLSCPLTTVASSGNDLTVSWTITPSPAFASETTPKNLYLSARDMSNASVGWTDRGDWLIKKTNAAPTLGGVTPSAAKSQHSVPQAFTAVSKDADGFANVWYSDFLVNVSTAVVYSIRVRYDRMVNRLYLYGDMGNSYADSCAPGEIKSVSNSQGTLNCASTTVAGSGTDLTVTWDITPHATFASALLDLYQDATDMSLQSPGWTRSGAWTVTNAPPTLGSVTHTPMTSVTSEAHSLTSSYSDANGFADLKSLKFLVNTTADPKDCILVQYDSTGDLYLYDNTGAAAVGSCKPGQLETLSNTQGSLNCAATTVTGSGNTLAVSWSITPSPAFSSGIPRNLYLHAVDFSNASAGWAVKGDWTIKDASPSPATAPVTPAGASVATPVAGQTAGGGGGCAWSAPDATHRRACVDTAAALAACLLEAETDGMHNEIRLVQGFYRGSFTFAQEEDYDLALVGGYGANCAGRGLNPALTVLDADLDGDGTGDGRVLEIDADVTPAQLRVERITMRNGVAATGDGGCLLLLTWGGAVLDGVEIAGCRAAGAGGAAAVDVGSGAALVRGSILRGSSAESGGGLAISSAGGKVTLINTTISGNAARIGGGVLIEGEPDGALELSNNIVWGNSAGISGDIHVAGYADPARVKVSGNNFTRMTTPETWPAPDESNINADPGFMTRDDLHLTESSPCRDAGAGTHPLAGSFDIDGDERRIGAAIDIGADEHAGAR